MKQNRYKRKIYIGLFVVLGVLVGIIAHGLIEMWYIEKLTTDFEKYSFDLTWADWFTIHKYFSAATFFGGIVLGYCQGKYWWKVVYEQQKLDPFFKKVRKFFHLPPARD